jgi:3-methyl-2-oxobutanoate hydroxymethyltransferase
MGNKRVTVATIREKKAAGVPFAMLTAYDYSMAKLIDGAGIETILVGDSLGNVILGYDSTLPVTVDDMIHHARAVCRGAKNALVAVDMPFMSYQASKEEALKNAGRIMKETGAQAVKMEGGAEIAETVRAVVAAGIPVIGHLGLTPQSVHQLGGFKVQGKDEQKAQQILNDAKLLDEAGVFAITLECVPTKLAEKITKSVKASTIGIGAGNGCDGQVLVVNDAMGMFDDFTPKFVRKFAKAGQIMTDAMKEYKAAVEDRSFPAPEHGFGINDDVLNKLY